MRRDRIFTRGPWEAKLGETATPALPTPAAVPVRRQRNSENAMSVLGRSLKGPGCQMVRGALIVLTCFFGILLRHFRTLLRVSVDVPPIFLALAGIRTGGPAKPQGRSAHPVAFLLGHITDLHDSRSYWIFKKKMNILHIAAVTTSK